MRFTNREWGRRVTPSLSLLIFGIRSGHRDSASGAQSLLPGTCTYEFEVIVHQVQHPLGLSSVEFLCLFEECEVFVVSEDLHQGR